MTKLLIVTLVFLLTIEIENCFGQFSCPYEYCNLSMCKEESDCEQDEILVPTLCDCCQICAKEEGKEGDTCGFGTCAKGYECINAECCKTESEDSDSDENDRAKRSLENNKEFFNNHNQGNMNGYGKGSVFGYEYGNNEYYNKENYRRKRSVEHGFNNEDNGGYNKENSYYPIQGNGIIHGRDPGPLSDECDEESESNESSRRKRNVEEAYYPGSSGKDEK